MVLFKTLPFIFTLLASSNTWSKTLELRVNHEEMTPKSFKKIFEQYNSINFFDETTQESKNWHHKDLLLDEILGISSEKAYAQFPQLRDQKSNEIIVAVIDNGVDINHQDLKDKIWINTDEIPNNNIDDDKNGYIDDYMGWNFLGATIF